MAEETAPKSQLRRAMGFWDVLLFNIAAVLGPRWIASAVRRGIIEHRGPRRARFSRDGVEVTLKASACEAENGG
jgi:hypothetical protein